MENFREISATELESAIKMIGDDWMLITAYDEENKRANERKDEKIKTVHCR